MNTPRSIVLRAAGTNCEFETQRALELSGSDCEIMHIAKLLQEPQRLDEVELIVIAGGFSYGDDVAAGRVFGLELRRNLADRLQAFVARGGLVLGICNGFQVLVDTGLLGLGEHGEREFALTGNASNHYECRWVTLKSEACACPWLVADEVWPTPIAHAEGQLCIPDADALARLEARGQIAIRYVNQDGSSADGAYPANPNGSVQDIAGLCDPTGRVLGLMPHPERNLTPWNHPRWNRLGERSEGEGLAFYRRMVEVARNGASNHATAAVS